MHITLADAIRQIRDDLREAILEDKDQDIVFTPQKIEMELTITFQDAGRGGFKLLTFLDLSTGAELKNAEHKIKLTFNVSDKKDNQVKTPSDQRPANIR